MSRGVVVPIDRDLIDEVARNTLGNDGAIETLSPRIRVLPWRYIAPPATAES